MWLFCVFLASLTPVYADERYIAADDAVPFPNCNAYFNAPCSAVNVRKSVMNTKLALETASDASALNALLMSIHNEDGSFDNEVDGFGFGALVINVSDQKILAAPNNINDGILHKTLHQILEVDASGCPFKSDMPDTNFANCHLSQMTIIQHALFARWQAAALDDGWTSWVWTGPHSQQSGKATHYQLLEPDTRIGFVQSATTVLGEFLVVSGFADRPLEMSSEMRGCSANENALCSVQVTRRLVGDVLTNIIKASSHAELEKLYKDMTFPLDGPGKYQSPSSQGWYTFCARWGDNSTYQSTEGGLYLGHILPFFIGKDLPELLRYINNTAVDGWDMHMRFLDNAAAGGGWASYPWTTDVAVPPRDKVAFIVGTERFGEKLYCGSGFYMTPRAQKTGPRCQVCSAESSYPCASYNAYSLLSSAYVLMISSHFDNSADAWPALSYENAEDSDKNFVWPGGFNVFVFAYNGTCVADGGNPANVGHTLWSMFKNSGVNSGCNFDGTSCSVTNVDGVALHDRLVAVAESTSVGGWVDYDYQPHVAEPKVNKVAYVIKLSRFNSKFYMGVAYNNEVESYNNCSAEYDSGCSEDNVLGLVGHVQTAIQIAQTEEMLNNILTNVTHGADDGSSLYKRRGGFFLEVYNVTAQEPLTPFSTGGSAQSSPICQAHGGDPSLVGKTYTTIVQDETIIHGNRHNLSATEHVEKWASQTWYAYSIQHPVQSEKVRKAYTMVAKFKPLGASFEREYYIISGFRVKHEPPACEALNEYPNAACDPETDRLKCDSGYMAMFNESARPGCAQAMQLPFKCEQINSPCPAGQYAIPEGPSLVCRDCTFGMFSSEAGQTVCQTCPAGRFAEQEGLSICKNCSIGTSSGEGRAVCEDCEAGRFAASAGLSSCSWCPEAHYSDMAGQSACRMCRAGFTSIMGSTSEQECKCKEGSYLVDQGHISTPSNSTTSTCADCPEGMLCLVGSRESAFGVNPGEAPQLKPGFWSSIEAPLIVYDCFDEKRCLGGAPESCAIPIDDEDCEDEDCVSKEGFVCATCPAGYTETGSTLNCLPCQDLPVFKAILLMIVLLACTICLYYCLNVHHHWRLTPRENAVISAEMLIEVVQVISVLSEISVPWSKPIQMFLDGLSHVTFGIAAIVPPVCFFPGVFATYFMDVYAVPWICIMLWILCGLSQVAPERFRWCTKRTQNTMGKVYNTIFVTQLTLALSPLVCSKHTDSTMVDGAVQTSVRVYPGILCGSSGWANMVIAGSFSLMISMFYFAFLCFEMYRAPAKLNGPEARKYMKGIVFAIEDFRAERYYFNIPAKIQEFMFCLIFLVHPDTGARQIQYFIGVLLISLGILTMMWPFKSPILNLTFAFIYGVIAEMLHCATALLPTITPEVKSAFEREMLILLLAGSFSITLVLILAVANVAISPHSLFPLVQFRREPDPKSLYDMWRSVAALDEPTFERIVSRWQLYSISSFEAVLPLLSSTTNPGRSSTLIATFGSPHKKTLNSAYFESARDIMDDALDKCQSIGVSQELAKVQSRASVEQAPKANVEVETTSATTPTTQETDQLNQKCSMIPTTQETDQLNEKCDLVQERQLFHSGSPNKKVVFV
jgi:hypothetical protein